MSENVPPLALSPDAPQTLDEQGVEAFTRPTLAELIAAEMSPPVPVNVPPSVPPQRIEAIGFGAYYCAAYRRDGAPDVLLDDADGRPQRFTSATAAIKAAEIALHFKPAAPTDEDILGARHFHEARAAAEVALQIEALGGVVVDGRIVPVEVRRR